MRIWSGSDRGRRAILPAILALALAACAGLDVPDGPAPALTPGSAQSVAPPAGAPPLGSPSPESPTPESSIAGHEGYGSVTRGGSGGRIYHVTSLADEGPGTLRDGILNRIGARVIVFDVAGTITLERGITIRFPYLTIDGSTAPSPGITIRAARERSGIIINGTSDIIVRHLRFHGTYAGEKDPGNFVDTIAIFGGGGPRRGGAHLAERIVLDHLTVRNAGDSGPDLWGSVQDVTVSWCFFFHSRHPTTVSFRPPAGRTRQRISMHHNVYAKNGERNPQVRGDVRDFDFVNNVVYGYGFYGEANWGYGVRIRNRTGDGHVHANLIGNYFLATFHPAWALVYGASPGPDAEDGGPPGTLPQGALITSSRLGRLYVAGNVLPAENRDQYSTIAQPLAIPPHARVTTWPAEELGARVVPHVGMKYRDATEQAILDEIAAGMDARGEAPRAARDPRG